MPRHARIDQPGLLQHVIVRGINKNEIFTTDDDRHDFVERFHLLLKETGTICYAWALLDNHFHLLLMPIEQTLATFMRRLLTGYAVTYNKRHGRTGHLFQNRYKSIVCDENSYLLELVRYIHLNPVRAGIIANINDLASYPWAGHRQYLELPSVSICTDSDVLALFSRKKATARKKYLQFVADGLTQGTPRLASGGCSASRALDQSLGDDDLYDDRVLGGGYFVERVVGKEDLETAAAPLDEIIKRVAARFGVVVGDLKKPGKSRPITSVKAVICYLATRRGDYSGVEVGKRIGYTRSAVSRAVKRGKQICDGEADLLRLLD